MNKLQVMLVKLPVLQEPFLLAAKQLDNQGS